MVQCVGMPSRWAVSWTWNQRSGCSFPGATRSRTRSAKTSAPPPRVVDQLLRRQGVRVRLPARRRERAELALHAADVRLVEVQVLDEVDLVRAAAQPPREVGQLT